MERETNNQWTITKSDTFLPTWIEAFLIDRKAQGLSKGTLYFYQKKLQKFMEFADSQVITQITQLTPLVIREYLLWLEQHGHNAGGIHAFYRSLKTFLLWWEDEIQPDNWRNPIRRVKAPKLSQTPLQPANLKSVNKMLNTCDQSFIGRRDHAILLVLLDTGVRAAELCAMQIDDLNSTRHSVYIPEGKGGKSRTVFLGKRTRRAVRAYLKTRNDGHPAMWITSKETPLTYWGLREMIRRRAKRARVDPPGVHDFRRAFALQCLRNGMDVYSLQKLMGHADLQVLRRYLAQTQDDILRAHSEHGPVDKL